jgi:hypothetical protein
VRAIGKVTTFLVLVAVAVAVIVGIRSIPDIKRYRDIRRM